MANKWMTKLQKLSGAVIREHNPLLNVVSCASPSVNFIFGNTWGLPLGYSMVLYGPPKGGKTVLSNSFVGQIHQENPEAICIKFDTEFRDTVQLTSSQLKVYGIDDSRYLVYETNRPDEIFDRIEGEINAQCQEGMPLKLIIIDSVTGILGRRGMNADTIMQQQIGDKAATIQEGLGRILPVIRRNKIALIMTTQIRAELDQNEIRRGNTVKMSAGFALRHMGEYFCYIEPNRSKDGRSTLNGQELVNTSKLDLLDHEEKVGHKVRVIMKDSSCGPKGRAAEFTLDYHQGIINQWEEVFLLGVKRGTVHMPNNRSYVLTNFPKEGEESKWSSKNDFLMALKNDKAVYDEVIKRVKMQDLDVMEGRSTSLGESKILEEEDSDLEKRAEIE